MESHPSWVKARIRGFFPISRAKFQMWAMDRWMVPMTKVMNLTVSLDLGSQLDRAGTTNQEKGAAREMGS
ncbi:MAG: hypothetical protein BWY88_01370 [Synergistetes bacterium ADurb.Bin520]|nr:MAG: hypothetical protein BWY88_01370 [Synergistetes bacterium ADurb.Bin520]